MFNELAIEIVKSKNKKQWYETVAGAAQMTQDRTIDLQRVP